MFRALRVAVRRGCVVVRIVPVAAPLVDIVADIVKAKSVGSIPGNGFGPCLPARFVVWERLWRIITPGKLFLLQTAARREFPLGLGGKVKTPTGLGS